MNTTIKYCFWLCLLLCGCSDNSLKKADSPIGALARHCVEKLASRHQTNWQISVSSTISEERERAFVTALSNLRLQNVTIDHAESVKELPSNVKLIILRFESDAEKATVELATVYGPKNGEIERIQFHMIHDEWFVLNKTVIGEM